MIKPWLSCAVWSLLWLMRSRIQMRQQTSTTQSKMSMISWSQVIGRTPPTPGGVSYLLCIQNQIKIPWSSRRKWTAPEEPPQKLINFECSSGGVFFLRVLDLETTQQRNPRGGGGFFRSCLWYARGLCLCPCVITPRGLTNKTNKQTKLLPCQHRRRSIVFEILFQQTNKQTNDQPPPKDGEIALWSGTTGEIVHFLILPGSPLSNIEITEYTCCSVIQSTVEFKYKSDYNIVQLVLIIGLIPFMWNTFYYISAVRVRSKCDFSILGRLRNIQSVRSWNWGWRGFTAFTSQMAYYQRKIRQEIMFSRNCLEHVFNVTFWDLYSALLIDSMRLRKGFLWNFGGFTSLSSLRWDHKLILCISGETITKDKGPCDSLGSGLRLSRK